MIFARKVPEFYIIIARKIFSRILGGTCPPPCTCPTVGRTPVDTGLDCVTFVPRGLDGRQADSSAVRHHRRRPTSLEWVKPGLPWVQPVVLHDVDSDHDSGTPSPAGVLRVSCEFRQLHRLDLPLFLHDNKHSLCCSTVLDSTILCRTRYIINIYYIATA